MSERNGNATRRIHESCLRVAQCLKERTALSLPLPNDLIRSDRQLLVRRAELLLNEGAQAADTAESVMASARNVLPVHAQFIRDMRSEIATYGLSVLPTIRSWADEPGGYMDTPPDVITDQLATLRECIASLQTHVSAMDTEYDTVELDSTSHDAREASINSADQAATPSGSAIRQPKAPGRILASIPHLDRNTGAWVTQRNAVKIIIDAGQSCTIQNLRARRADGDKGSGGKSGIDPSGRVWRKDPDSKQVVWYLKKSLPNSENA